MSVPEPSHEEEREVMEATTYSLEPKGIARCHACGYCNPTLVKFCAGCSIRLIALALVSMEVAGVRRNEK